MSNFNKYGIITDGPYAGAYVTNKEKEYELLKRLNCLTSNEELITGDYTREKGIKVKKTYGLNGFNQTTAFFKENGITESFLNTLQATKDNAPTFDLNSIEKDKKDAQSIDLKSALKQMDGCRKDLRNKYLDNEVATIHCKGKVNKILKNQAYVISDVLLDNDDRDTDHLWIYEFDSLKKYAVHKNDWIEFDGVVYAYRRSNGSIDFSINKITNIRILSTEEVEEDAAHTNETKSCNACDGASSQEYETNGNNIELVKEMLKDENVRVALAKNEELFWKVVNSIK